MSYRFTIFFVGVSKPPTGQQGNAGRNLDREFSEIDIGSTDSDDAIQTVFEMTQANRKKVEAARAAKNDHCHSQTTSQSQSQDNRTMPCSEQAPTQMAGYDFGDTNLPDNTRRVRFDPSVVSPKGGKPVRRSKKLAAEAAARALAENLPPKRGDSLDDFQPPGTQAADMPAVAASKAKAKVATPRKKKKPKRGRGRNEQPPKFRQEVVPPLPDSVDGHETYEDDGGDDWILELNRSPRKIEMNDRDEGDTDGFIDTASEASTPVSDEVNLVCFFLLRQ